MTLSVRYQEIEGRGRCVVIQADKPWLFVFITPAQARKLLQALEVLLNHAP